MAYAPLEAQQVPLMPDKSASSRQAVTAIVNEMLATADELEAQAETWAAALETLGQERAAELRRKAFELDLRLRADRSVDPTSPAAPANDGETHTRCGAHRVT